MPRKTVFWEKQHGKFNLLWAGLVSVRLWDLEEVYVPRDLISLIFTFWLQYSSDFSSKDKADRIVLYQSGMFALVSETSEIPDVIVDEMDLRVPLVMMSDPLMPGNFAAFELHSNSNRIVIGLANESAKEKLKSSGFIADQMTIAAINEEPCQFWGLISNGEFIPDELFERNMSLVFGTKKEKPLQVVCDLTDEDDPFIEFKGTESFELSLPNSQEVSAWYVCVALSDHDDWVRVEHIDVIESSLSFVRQSVSE